METKNLATKVLEWLNKCGFGFVSTAKTCGDCPYRESGCDGALHEDAIKVIKALMGGEKREESRGDCAVPQNLPVRL